MILRKSFFVTVCLMLTVCFVLGCSAQKYTPPAPNPNDAVYASPIPNEYMTSDLESQMPTYYELRKENATDWNALIDNTTPLSTLLERNDWTMPLTEAWYCSVAVYDTQGMSSSGMTFSAYVYEALYGGKITFIRDTGESYSHPFYNNKTFTKMYTVFRVEDGGYMYCFFDYCKESNLTIAKRAAWVHKPHQYEDFAQLHVGDPAEYISRIDPIARYAIQYDTVASTHLLRDGVLQVTYDNNTIASMNYYADYIMPNENVFDSIREDAPEEMLSEYLQYNMTILEQDYPQG